MSRQMSALAVSAALISTAMAGADAALMVASLVLGQWLPAVLGAVGVLCALGGFCIAWRTIGAREAAIADGVGSWPSGREPGGFLADPTDPGVAVLANGRLGRAVRVGPQQDDGVLVDLANVQKVWPIVGYWEPDPRSDREESDHE